MAKSTGNIARVDEVLARGVSAAGAALRPHRRPLPGAAQLQRRVAGRGDRGDRAPRRGAPRARRVPEDRPDDPSLAEAARGGPDGLRRGTRRRSQRVAGPGRPVRPRPRGQPPDRRADDVDRRRGAGHDRHRGARRRCSGIGPEAGSTALEPALQALLDARSRAREARDWATSDRLRDELAAAGHPRRGLARRAALAARRGGSRWLIPGARARTAAAAGPSARSIGQGRPPAADRRGSRPRPHDDVRRPAGGHDPREPGRRGRPAFGLHGSEEPPTGRPHGAGSRISRSRTAAARGSGRTGSPGWALRPATAPIAGARGRPVPGEPGVRRVIAVARRPMAPAGPRGSAPPPGRPSVARLRSRPGGAWWAGPSRSLPRARSSAGRAVRAGPDDRATRTTTAHRPADRVRRTSRRRGPRVLGPAHRFGPGRPGFPPPGPRGRPPFRPRPDLPRPAAPRPSAPSPRFDLVDPEADELVAGRRPVEEAFVARREARRLLVVPQRRQALEKLVLHATNLRIPIVEVEGGTLTALAGFDGHQGVALVVGAPPLRRGSTTSLARAIERDEPPFVLVLDSLEDPQNVGTLLRSAEAAAIHGVVFPTRRQAPLSPSAVKASAGAVEHLLLAPVDDLAGDARRPPRPRAADRRRRRRRAVDGPRGRPARTAGARRRQRGPGPRSGRPPALRPARPDPDARRRRLAQRRRSPARSCSTRRPPSAGTSARLRRTSPWRPTNP